MQATQIYFGYFHVCQFSKNNYALKYFQLKVISYGLQIKSFKNTVESNYIFNVSFSLKHSLRAQTKNQYEA